VLRPVNSFLGATNVHEKMEVRLVVKVEEVVESEFVAAARTGGLKSESQAVHPPYFRRHRNFPLFNFVFGDVFS
jgi:hypothetical protein